MPTSELWNWTRRTRTSNSALECSVRNSKELDRMEHLLSLFLRTLDRRKLGQLLPLTLDRRRPMEDFTSIRRADIVDRLGLLEPVARRDHRNRSLL